ncbi:hypothetical protein OC846_002893 [Tilletia horrida]|uniref:BHLH domain-containing protein n=1 Tax=Tilletia horrida TaxID=155126 RepID=A0AAN6GQP5_9BASI|nr:hypothetical protein OC846_002893 [Tilletia horrida]
MPRSNSIQEAFSPYLAPSHNAYAYAHPPPLGIFEPTGPSAAITDRSPHPSPMLMPTINSAGIGPVPIRSTKPSSASGATSAPGSGHFGHAYSMANSSRSTIASTLSSSAGHKASGSIGNIHQNIPAALLPPPAHPMSHFPASSTSSMSSPGTAGTGSKRASASTRDSKRRATHSQIERRRREKINDRLITLRNLVPACAREVEERRRIKAEEEEAARRAAKGLPPLNPTGAGVEALQDASTSAEPGSASDKAKRKRNRRRAAAAAAAVAAQESGAVDPEDKEEDLGLHKLEVLTHAIDYIYELQARISDLEIQVARYGGSTYSSSIRSVNTALTSPVMSLHADSPIMAGLNRSSIGSSQLSASLKSSTISPLFEGFTVSGPGSAGLRGRHIPPLVSPENWKEGRTHDSIAEGDGDVSPVCLYGRVPNVSDTDMDHPPLDESNEDKSKEDKKGSKSTTSAPTTQSHEAFTAAAEALLSISVSPTFDTEGGDQNAHGEVRDSTGRLITPPALELGASAMDTEQ